MNRLYLHTTAQCILGAKSRLYLLSTDALGKIRDARAVEPLIEALKDEDNIFLNIQWKAADALCEIGDERAIELLAQVLKDGNKHVREGAAYALRKIEDCKKY